MNEEVTADNRRYYIDLLTALEGEIKREPTKTKLLLGEVLTKMDLPTFKEKITDLGDPELVKILLYHAGEDVSLLASSYAVIKINEIIAAK